MRTIVASSALLGTTATLLALFLVEGAGRPIGMTIGLLAAFATAAATANWAVRSAERRLLLRLLAGFRYAEGTNGEGTHAPGGDVKTLTADLGRTLRRLRRIEVESRPLERWAQGLVAAGAVSLDVSRNGGSATAAALEEVAKAASLAMKGSQGIASTVERLLSETTLQKKAILESASLVESSSNSHERMGRDASSTTRVGQEIRQLSTRGLEQAREAIRSLDRIRAHVEINGRKIRRHGDRSIEIGAIVNLITGISQRTDMLVLNATIESVRAGEQGRGFAVVAEDIRKLAERTSDAAKEISALVEVIQSETSESIMALDAEQVDILLGVRKVREVASSLEQIGGVAGESVRLGEGISEAVGEQARSILEATRATRRAAEATERILEGSRQVRDRCRVLADHQERLRYLLSADPSAPGFHVDRPESLENASAQESKLSSIE